MIKEDEFTRKVMSKDINGEWLFMIAGSGSDCPQIYLQSNFISDVNGAVVINCDLKQMKQIHKIIGKEIKIMKSISEDPIEEISKAILNACPELKRIK